MSWLIGENFHWKREMNLVGTDTAGLGDDTLHVLNLSLATGEGTELFGRTIC